jgi:hypothetical protein
MVPNARIHLFSGNETPNRDKSLAVDQNREQQILGWIRQDMESNTLSRNRRSSITIWVISSFQSLETGSFRLFFATRINHPNETVAQGKQCPAPFTK